MKSSPNLRSKSGLKRLIRKGPAAQNSSTSSNIRWCNSSTLFWEEGAHKGLSWLTLCEVPILSHSTHTHIIQSWKVISVTCGNIRLSLCYIIMWMIFMNISAQKWPIWCHLHYKFQYNGPRPSPSNLLLAIQTRSWVGLGMKLVNHVADPLCGGGYVAGWLWSRSI